MFVMTAGPICNNKPEKQSCNPKNNWAHMALHGHFTFMNQGL